MTEPRAGLPNPDASRAVLVGVSEYSTLEELPAVPNNVATLRRLLTDPDLWGLPDEHCRTLVNPTSVEQVLDTLHTAATAATDALLFYFAGHGLLDDRLDLHLALPGSDSDRLYRAVRYDDVRREIVGAKRVFGKVVILDCCYSGRALLGGMSGAVELADHARVDGSYVMTASAETKLALAPPGEEYTAFTGALVDKLAHGLENGPDLLDMETIFFHVRADLQARHRPVPQQRTRNDGRAIALVRNRRASGRGAVRELATPARELPKPPAGFEALVRWPPSELARRVRELRGSGDGDLAGELLAASAARRADQEVAAIIDLLRREKRSDDLEQVFSAAALRPPPEVFRIIDALREIDRPHEARVLLRAVAEGAAADIAELAHLMQVQKRIGVNELLDTALETARERSSITGLVNALWVAGLREEVDKLLTRAVRRLPGQAVVDLADQLRAVGREETAFGLYVAAATTVATRPPEVVAQLCQAMAADGAPIAEALVEMVTDAEQALGVAVAFWDTGQDSYAEGALERAGGTLPHPEVLSLAAELRARGRDEAAYRVCLVAALYGEADDVRAIVRTLRDVGRPVDAKNLLEAVAVEAPVHLVADLLADDVDRERILARAVERRPSEVADLVRALAPHPTVISRLVRLAVSMVESRIELLPVIAEHVSTVTMEKLLARVVDTSDGQRIARVLGELPPDDARLLFFFTVRKGNPVLRNALVVLQLATDRAFEDSEFAYLLEQPAERVEPFLAGLRAAGFEPYADAVLDMVAAEQAAPVVAARIASLYAAGQSDTAADLLAEVISDRSHHEIRELVRELRQLDQGTALDAVASWITAANAHMRQPYLDDLLRQLGLGEYASGKRRWRR
jgi:predicted transcriptional regulator